MLNNFRVRLKQYPGVREDLKEGHTYTVGDLHGNTMKMIHFLVSHGAMRLSKEQYDELYNTYEQLSNSEVYQAENTQQATALLETFTSLLDQAEFSNEGNNLFRFIGDTLADRGANDYLTLLVYKKLKDRGIPFKINFSNHDLEFIASMEDETYKSPLIPIGVATSLTNTLSLIENENISREEVSSLYQEVVVPNLQKYALDANEEGAVLYSHAPVLIQSLFESAKKLRIPVDFTQQEATLEQLQWLVDATNLETIKYAKNSSLTTENGPAYIKNIAKAEDIAEANQGGIGGKSTNHPIPATSSFAHASWNRTFFESEYEVSHKTQARLGIINVQGHTGPSGAWVVDDAFENRVRKDDAAVTHINLDTSQFGKKTQKDELIMWGEKFERNQVLQLNQQRVEFQAKLDASQATEDSLAIDSLGEECMQSIFAATEQAVVKTISQYAIETISMKDTQQIVNYIASTVRQVTQTMKIPLPDGLYDSPSYEAPSSPPRELPVYTLLLSQATLQAKAEVKKPGFASLGLGIFGIAATGTAVGVSLASATAATAITAALATTAAVLATATMATGIGGGVILLAALVCLIVWAVKQHQISSCEKQERAVDAELAKAVLQP
jgi:hypothetical protein